MVRQMAKPGSYAQRRLAEINDDSTEGVQTTEAQAPAQAAPELSHVANVGGSPVECESAEAAAALRTALQGIHDLMFRTGAL
jgi:hypothetical protein